MLSYWKLHKIPILLVLVNMLLYAVFSFGLQREDFLNLLLLFSLLFLSYAKTMALGQQNFNFLLAAGILCRLVFLCATPNLSQDFYRFIWDGQLINQGINPYLYTPNEIMGNALFHSSNSAVLHEGMGSLSAKHYSNYPPLNQIIFAISTFLGGGSVFGSIVVMRLFILGADIGTLYFGGKLLGHLGRSPKEIFWYFLNPLVIIELTGNLHFEGVMLFFFVWAMYLVSFGKWKWAAPVYALSILLKLVPLLFLPLFLRHFGIKRSVFFYLGIGLTALVFLLPFYSAEFFDNYGKSIGLWFSNFEFNASLYNLIKTIGIDFFDAKPWLLVKSYGKIVPMATIAIAIGLTFFRKNQNLPILLGSMLALLSSYYIFSSTVHPWYIIFLIVLGVFTTYRFAMVWSAMAVLSYFAYSHPDFRENLWLLALEYLVVFGYLVYELLKNRNTLQHFRKKFNLD